MKNKYLIRFVNALVFLPVMSVSLSMGGLHDTSIDYKIPQNILATQFNTESAQDLAIKQAVAAEVAKEQAEADAIDTYFKTYNMPLLGTGAKMVAEAEKNGIDWRLVPAIAVRESTGGKHDCIYYHFNPFGWGSCRIGFKSINDAIETVARSLGGNNPDTAHYYAGKTTKQILDTYNPPSIVAHYSSEVMSIMDAIGPADLTPTPTATS